MLSGINNSIEDYQGVISLMKAFSVQELVISRERRTYDLTSEQKTELINDVGILITSLQKNNLKYSLHSYSDDDRNKISNIVNKE